MSQEILDLLKQIEAHFHKVILEDDKPLIPEIIEEQGIQLPQLQPLLELDKPEGWLQLPGYYGGVEYWLRVEDDPIRLIAHIGSRMDQVDYTRLYEITPEGSRLLAKDNFDERVALYLNLKHS